MSYRLRGMGDNQTTPAAGMTTCPDQVCSGVYIRQSNGCCMSDPGTAAAVFASNLSQSAGMLVAPTVLPWTLGAVVLVYLLFFRGQR